MVDVDDVITCWLMYGDVMTSWLMYGNVMTCWLTSMMW